MEGKKVVIALFVAVVLVGVITYVMYVLTKLDDYDPNRTDQPISPAVIRTYSRLVELRVA